jgi:hypothetical protein
MYIKILQDKNFSMNDIDNNLPPPPQSFMRNLYITKGIESLPCGQIGVADFRAAQRRYVMMHCDRQIIQSKGQSQTRDPDPILFREVESLLLLDIVMNMP